MRELTVSLGAGDTLQVRVDAHYITVPLNERGLDVLRRVLRERARAPTHKRAIGWPASPIQAMIDVWLKENQPASSGMVLDLEGIDL